MMNAKEAMERTNKVIEERKTKEKQEAIKYLEEVVEKAIQEACDREERCCDINKMGIVLQNITIEKKLNELGYTVTNLNASRQFRISW